MIIYKLKKNQFKPILFIYLLISLNPLQAFELSDFNVIDGLVNRCYKDAEFCNSALSKVHKYQKNAALNKKFSCQTRLLGLEANLIMAMNSNLKRNEANRIIKAVKKHC
tara:strand:- start:64 stop:390 length:327 start_codon:yes stop_codon:yes gene_type:complete